MSRAFAVWFAALMLGSGAFGQTGDGAWLVARARAEVRVLCGDGRRAPAPLRREHGGGVAEWPVDATCDARLEMLRTRRPAGRREIELLAVRVRLTNRSGQPRLVPLIVTIAPASATAPALRSLAFERHAFSVEGEPVLVAQTPARGAILAESAFAPRPLAWRAEGFVQSAAGECRGELGFDLELAPGATRALAFLCPSPRADSPPAEVTLDFLRGVDVDELFATAEKEGR